VAEALPDLEAIAKGGTAANNDAMIADGAWGGERRYKDHTRRTAAVFALQVFFHLEEPHQRQVVS
jgi:hypothetical protein